MIFCLLSSAVWAQQDNQGVFDSPVMPGPSSVYVFAYVRGQHMQRPAQGRTFTLYKEDKKGSGFRKLTTMGFPPSAAELAKKLDAELLQEILQRQKLRSVEDLYTQLKAGKLDTLGLYSSASNVLEALGVLYIDKTVTRRDIGVSYKMEVADQEGARTLYQLGLGEIQYSPMPVFKKYNVYVSDSVAMVTWYAVKGKAPYASVFSNGAVSGRVMIYSRRDTLFAMHSMSTRPGTRLALFVRPEDIAGNTGLSSDTVRLLTLNMNNALSVSHLTAMDTLGRVELHWDSLPAKAYYSGIRILKSRSATSDYIVADTLPASAVSYQDRRILGGTQYYYRVEPLLIHLPQGGRTTPALVTVTTEKREGRPSHPQGLAYSFTARRDIRLSWQAGSQLDIFSYYILRGSSNRDLKVISAAIKDTVFIDSVEHLAPGATYVYAVCAMNMDMQWSDTSAPVSMVEPGARLVTSPAGITARATPQGVRLHWNDVSLADAGVTGYLVYKRKKGETYFKPLTMRLWQSTVFTDTTGALPGIYEYGCTAVDAWGNQSILSTLVQVDLSGVDAMAAPSVFTLRNVKEGIEVSVPSSVNTMDTRTKYLLYRRTVKEKQYHKIGEVPADHPVYIDKAVMPDQLYAYAISVRSQDVESSKGGEKSIRRK